MTDVRAGATVIRLDEIEAQVRGPLSRYQKLIGDDGHPILIGVQTTQPGFQTPDHYHPYLECVFVLEGTMEVWVVGEEPTVHVLKPGDMFAAQPEVPHAFRNPGPGILRHLGVHNNPTRASTWLTDGTQH